MSEFVNFDNITNEIMKRPFQLSYINEDIIILDDLEPDVIINNTNDVNGLSQNITLEQSYYSMIIPLAAFDNGYSHNGYYSFSFSLIPTNCQPSGSINVSKLTDMTLSYSSINSNNSLFVGYSL
jgi:Large eukaryotic DNA virus major capsid protein